jgi:ribosomal protein L44E
MLPKQLRMFCGHDKCGYETLREIKDAKVNFDRSIHQDIYQCRNCGMAFIRLSTTRRMYATAAIPKLSSLRVVSNGGNPQRICRT